MLFLNRFCNDFGKFLRQVDVFEEGNETILGATSGIGGYPHKWREFITEIIKENEAFEWIWVKLRYLAANLKSFSRNTPVWERVRARINLQQLSRVWLIFFHFFIDFLNIFRSIYRKFSTFEARLARILTFFEEKNQEFFDRAEK